MSEELEEWRPLAPASLLANLLPEMGRTVGRLWPLVLLATFAGARVSATPVLMVAALFLTASARAAVRSLTTRYRVFQGRLELEQGLIARRHRTMDLARIQNVEARRGVFHRFAGIVELRIETAGGSGEPEVQLSAVSEEEAAWLRTALQPARAVASAAAPPTEELLALDTVELLAFGGAQLRVVPAFVIAMALAEWGALVSPRWLRPPEAGGAAQGLALLLVGIGVAWVMGVGEGVLRYAGFRLTREHARLRVASGLFTQRRVDVALARIQTVSVEAPLLRRLLGYTSLRVETAAAAVPGDPTSGEARVPMVRDVELLPTLEAVLPGAGALADPERELRPAAARAVLRATFRGVLRGALAGGAAAWMGGAPLALLGLPGPILGWLDGRARAWELTERHLLARHGWWSQETWIVPRARIQSVHLVQGPFQRLAGLAQVVVWVAGTSVALPELDEAEAERLFAALGGASGHPPPHALS